MKKRSALFFALVCSLCLFMFGCSHDIVDDPADKFRGYWECVKLQMDGEVYENTYFDEDAQLELPVYSLYAFAFADDGSGYLAEPFYKLYSNEEVKEAFTWKEENDGVTVYGSNDTSIPLEYTDGQLIMSIDENMKMWFSKVDKLTEFVPEDWTKEREDAGNE